MKPAVARLGRTRTEAGAALLERYREVRAFTEALCAPLQPEDCVVQSMPDASPTRWHLAHVSWFFETFVLREALPDLKPLDPRYHYLFNSYYNTVGAQFPRPRRGLLSRPTVAEVYAYRRWVDDHMEAVLAGLDPEAEPARAAVVELGLNHEQQHQELILTDIKHVLAQNPLFPAYRECAGPASKAAPALAWVGFDPGLVEIGHAGEGFAFDNEGPRHEVYVQPFQLASRPITNGEFLAFVEDGGYERPELWLSDAWLIVPRAGWRQPDYWHRLDDGWYEFTLRGLEPLDLEAPAAHLSYFEADAYARWSGARLPRETEWEVAAETVPLAGNFVETESLHPRTPAPASDAPLRQMFGDVWEWTSSPYAAYPGYTPPDGAFGEYNGKFMCNQMVLRGGSCATSVSHVRGTYRNFFPADARWQFSGLRLARDA